MNGLYRAAAMCSLFLIPICPHDARAFLNTRAKIVLHVVSFKGDDVCLSQVPKPCNYGEEHFSIRAEVGNDYSVYVMIVDGEVDEGIGSASFGLDYDPRSHSGIDIDSWTLCADQQKAAVNWPAAGSSIRIEWDPDHCQREAVPGDSDSSVTALLGVFRVHAYSEDLLEIKPVAVDDGAKVGNCAGREIWIQAPHATSRAYFGPKPGGGYDPCRGPFSSAKSFQELTDEELESVQILLRPKAWPRLRVSNNDIRVLLYGKNAAGLDWVFGGFRRVGVEYGGLFPVAFPTETRQLNAVINVILDSPEADELDYPEDHRLSVTVLSTHSQEPRAFEVLADSAAGSQLVSRIQDAIENDEVRATIQEMATYAGILKRSEKGRIRRNDHVASKGFIVLGLAGLLAISLGFARARKHYF